MSEPRMHLRSFEGLFERALRPDEAFREELRQAGYDSQSPQNTYPVAIWHECQRIAARRVFGHLEPGEALWQLGLLFMQGLAQTVVGRVLGATAPMLGAERVISRM